MIINGQRISVPNVVEGNFSIGYLTDTLGEFIVPGAYDGHKFHNINTFEWNV